MNKLRIFERKTESGWERVALKDALVGDILRMRDTEESSPTYWKVTELPVPTSAKDDHRSEDIDGVIWSVTCISVDGNGNPLKG